MQPKKVSEKITYLILIISLISIISCIIIRVSLVYAFLCAVIFSIIVLLKEGFKLSKLLQMIYYGIKECFSIFVIILLMGCTIAIWLACGAVPAMIYYGFDYIQHINYLLACFLISGVISIFMGTALGTISTIGMALLGIGRGLNIPSHILLGAIISGAFIADKVSPIAGLVNLTLKTTGVKYKEYVKEHIRTFIPVIVISSVIYFVIGRNYTCEIDILKLTQYQNNISNVFNISPILLLFPLIIIIMAVIGIRVIPNMCLGVFGGILVSVFVQKIKVKSVIKIIVFGYQATSNMEELNSILKGGGIIPMIEVILIVMGAIALNSIFDGTNMIKPMLDKKFSKVKTKGKLIANTAIISGILTITTCDQSVGILIPGKFLKNKYEELGLNRERLAVTISDSGIIIAPLIPWNVNSIIIAVITGVSVTKYAPYTVLCYFAPIITIVLGYRQSKAH
jgi:NhaC family Na+:H+ antiporter